MMNPENTEDLKRTEIEIPYGRRVWGFHREPEMPLSEWGYVTAEWRIGTEQPMVRYFVEGGRGKRLHMLEVEHAFSDWEEGKSELPTAPSKPKTGIRQQWTATLDPHTGELEMLSKDFNNLFLNLVVKAQQTIIENPSLEESGLK